MFVNMPDGLLEARRRGLPEARRRIAAFMARKYSTDTAVEELPQELVYSFDVVTDILRTMDAREPFYYTFAEWWSVAGELSEPEEMLR